MGRHRSRSRSYSPRRRSRTPPHIRKKHYDDPRDRRLTDRRSPPPSGLLVRNIPLDTRPEELRTPFEKFGPVKDVYLPRDYYTGEPRGFGFVKFRYPEDAAKAKDRLNYTIIGGREIRIVYAEENRKTPREMRRTGHTRGKFEGRRKTPTRSPRRQYRSHSRSPVTKRRDSRSVSRLPSHRIERDYSSDRSRSPLGERARSTRLQTPRGERDNLSNRSPSPKKNSPDESEYKRGLRSPSPRDTTHDWKRYKSSQRSHSPRKMTPHDEDDQSSRRSCRSREISPCDGKSLRLSKRPNPRRESPLGNESPNDREHQKGLRSPSPRSVKSHDGNSYKSSQRRSSPRDMSPYDENNFRSSERSVCPPEESILGEDCKLKHKFRTSREVLLDIDE